MPLPPPRPKIKYKFSKNDVKIPAVGSHVKNVQLPQAVDLLGNKKTLRATPGHYLVKTERGILAISEDSQRAVEILDGGMAIEYNLADAVNLGNQKPIVTKE